MSIPTEVIPGFAEATQSAEQWSQNDSTKFNLVQVDNIHGKLVFKYETISFYVVCVDFSGEAWNVWSDDDVVIAQMGPIQDYVHSCTKKGLPDILSYIDHKLSPLVRRISAGLEPIPLLPAAIIAQQAAAHDASIVEGAASPMVVNQMPPALVHREDSDVDLGYDEEVDDNFLDDNVDDNNCLMVDQADDDMDAVEEGDPRVAAEAASSLGESYGAGQVSQVAIHRILKDLKWLQESQCKNGITISPKTDNLAIWEVKLVDFPESGLLGSDLKIYSQQFCRETAVILEVNFPVEYPMNAPFIRIVRPRLKNKPAHITQAGAFCMDVLSKTGWSPAHDIDAILIQIRADMISDKWVCLDERSPDEEYNKAEALMSFHLFTHSQGL